MTENESRKKDKNVMRHSTAFYIEALVLVAAFTAVILVLTLVFARSRQMSEKARLLTCAVHLAENAAEAVSASDSPEVLYELLDEGGNAQIFQETASRDFYFQSSDIPFSVEEYSRICAWYDREMNPMPEGEFWVEIVWLPEKADETGSGGNAGMIRSIIAVYWYGETVYTLDTAVYRRQKP